MGEGDNEIKMKMSVTPLKTTISYPFVKSAQNSS